MQDSKSVIEVSPAVKAFANIREELVLENIAVIGHEGIVTEASRTAPATGDKDKIPALERMLSLHNYLSSIQGIESVALHIQDKDFAALLNPLGETGETVDGMLKTAGPEVFLTAYYLLRFYMYGGATRCLLVQDGIRLLFLANDPENPTVWAGHRLL